MELIARGGVSGVTYEAVAKLSGSSRATLYRRWPHRDDLIRAALTSYAETSVRAPTTQDVRADLVELLCGLGATLATPVGRAIVNASVTAAGDDPLRRLGQEVLQARLEVLQDRIDAAVSAHQLPADVDARFLNTMLTAPVYLSVMRDHRPLTREFAQQVVTAVLDGMTPR